MGSAAPLVQPVEPGQTVPGAAPSSKFTKENDPPAAILAARAARSPGETGRLWSHVARSTMAARTIAVREWGTWRFTGQPPFLRIEPPADWMVCLAERRKLHTWATATNRRETREEAGREPSPRA